MQDPKYVKEAFSRIADRYVVTNHVLSLGTDILWRKKVGCMVADWEPQSILDVATGTGDLALEIQRKCPDAKVTGSDFCEEMLAYAADGGVRETIVADAMNMPFDDDSYDVLTVAFGLRNMASWPDALKEMHRVIKPGGHILILDFSLPTGILRGPYRFYLNKILPKIAGLMTGEGDAYEYLAGTIEQFPSGKDMTNLIEANGFSGAESDPLTFGVASIYTATA